MRLAISSLYICVCVEFLMTMGDFFTKGMGETPTGNAADIIIFPLLPA